jgi:hypothetical protein
MRTEFENFISKLLRFGRVLSPVELDVQLRITNRRLCKDLDNIMMDIAPLFSELILSEDSYIQGYRIYVMTDPSAVYRSADLRIKILPPHCICDFENYMEQVLDKGRGYLENHL